MSENGESANNDNPSDDRIPNSAEARIVSEIKKSKEKDLWDKFGIAASALAGIGVALIVAILTYVSAQASNEIELLKVEIQSAKTELEIWKAERDAEDRAKELDVTKLEVMERFLPHISQDEQRRAAALIALSEFGYAKVSMRFATMYEDNKTREAIDRIMAWAPKSKIDRAELEAIAAVTVRPSGSDKPPIASGSPPTNANVESKPVRGWVYLGQHRPDGNQISTDKWATKYLRFDYSKSPDQLKRTTATVLSEKGALNVRAGPPSLFGAMQQVIDVLPAAKEVKLLEKMDLTFSGGVWYEVEYRK